MTFFCTHLCLSFVHNDNLGILGHAKMLLKILWKHKKLNLKHPPKTFVSEMIKSLNGSPSPKALSRELTPMHWLDIKLNRYACMYAVAACIHTKIPPRGSGSTSSSPWGRGWWCRSRASSRQGTPRVLVGRFEQLCWKMLYEKIFVQFVQFFKVLAWLVVFCTMYACEFYVVGRCLMNKYLFNFLKC